MEGHKDFERLRIRSPHDLETLERWTEIKQVKTFTKYQKHLPALVSAVLVPASVQSLDQVPVVQELRIMLMSTTQSVIPRLQRGMISAGSEVRVWLMLCSPQQHPSPRWS